MKKTLPFLIMFTVWVLSFTSISTAQTAIAYTYDALGNRTERKTITLKSSITDTSANNMNEKDKKKEVFEENFDEKKVLIYPNPTRGELKIELNGYNKDARAGLYLYSLSGSLIMGNNIVNNAVTLDLSSYASGTYVLKIVLGDNVSEWKIVKE